MEGPSNFLSSLYNYLPLLLSSRTSVAVSHTAALSTLTYLHRFFPSANSPWFNELFYFNVHESPANLMDQTLLIQVFNSRFLGRNALIGSFSLDLALVWCCITGVFYYTFFFIRGSSGFCFFSLMN